MGGGAFMQAAANGELTLNVPRLTPSEYAHLKDVYLTKLQGYFANSQVLCPAATPDKDDHGDIDFIVASEGPSDFLDMANTMGATGLICRSSLNCTLGVRKDGTSSPRSAVVYKHCHLNNKPQEPADMTVTMEEYAQIDIELVPPHLFEWHSFYASYGGMAGLLGHIVHNLGFTISNTGLWLRLKELEDARKSKVANIADTDGRLQLSYDPVGLMQFLGLSLERYRQGFMTLGELYSWLGECRLMSLESIKLGRDRAHEQNREQMRPVFARFFDEWLPTHMQTSEERPAVDLTRQWYAEEAVSYFTKQPEYERMRSTLMRTIDNGIAAQLLKPIIAIQSQRQDKQLNEIVRAFRRYVRVDANGHLHILATPHVDEASELHGLLACDRAGLQDEAAVSAWVKEHWKEVRALERQRRK